MKQIFDEGDFKTLIESAGLSLVTDIKFVDNEITYTQVINVEGLKRMYERAGLIVRDIKITKGEIIVTTDPPNNFLKPKDG